MDTPVSLDSMRNMYVQPNLHEAPLTVGGCARKKNAAFPLVLNPYEVCARIIPKVFPLLVFLSLGAAGEAY